MAISNVSFSKKRDLGFLELGYRAGPFASAGVNVGVPILDSGLPSTGVGAHGTVHERDLGLSRVLGSNLVGDVSSPHVSFKVIDSNLVSSQGFAVLAPTHKGVISDSILIPQRNGGVPSFAQILNLQDLDSSSKMVDSHGYLVAPETSKPTIKGNYVCVIVWIF
ncbi:hypothetical protein PanWU01x14_011990, partial [Parasponia andersonii]